MRPELEQACEKLLALCPTETDVSLEVVAEALIGVTADHAEIDLVIERLEQAGRTVGQPTASAPADRIGRMLSATRSLASELARAPTEGEVATRAEMSLREVRVTRLLVQIMQR